MTEAQRRSAAIKESRRTRRAPAYRIPPPPGQEPAEQTQRRSGSTPVDSEWIDDGPIDVGLRSTAARAAGRAVGRIGSASPTDSTRRRERHLDPEFAAEIAASIGDADGRPLAERLAAANDALERDRLEEAKRIVDPLRRRFPTVSAVHETAGLIAYRRGDFKQAARSLERAQELRADVDTLPVLADCYRALGRYTAVASLWTRIKSASPRHEVMAEGRIVMAGALADQGRLAEAIDLLDPGDRRIKRVRDHHLRQWYALADLYDRAGDTVSARNWFGAVAAHDPDFVDVAPRLRALGR